MEEQAAQSMDMFMSGAILLAAALIFVLIFRRLGLGAVLGYIVAGVVIGPQGLGLFNDGELIVHFAEIGIVLLLFLVGLELAPSRLWRLKKDIFGLGLLQTALCGLALSFLIWQISGISIGAALALGLPLGLSSTAQILPMLQSAGRLNTPIGERAFSILLFQDLAIIPLLTIFAALSRAPAESGTTSGWTAIFYAGIAIIALVLAGRFVLIPVLKLIGDIAERELFIVAGLFAVFGSAALMHSIGLSAALGAFLAGVMLAETPYRHELEADIDPFRSLLLGLFFTGVGMLLDLNIVMAKPLYILGMACLLVAVKTGIIFALAKAFGMQLRQAFILGLLLSQGGEFGFVLYGVAQKALLISSEAASLFGAIITLSMAMTPFLIILSQKMGGLRRNLTEDLDDPENAALSNVIVIGHGRFGQVVSQICAGANISVTLIDISPDRIKVSGKYGRKVYYGDGTRIDVLRRAGADNADALIFCQDGEGIAPDKLEVINHSFPNAKILTRSSDRRHLIALQQSGQCAAVREVFKSSVALGHKTLLAMEIDEQVADNVVAEFKRRDLARLKAQMESDDMTAALHLSFGHDSSLAYDMHDGKAD